MLNFDKLKKDRRDNNTMKFMLNSLRRARQIKKGVYLTKHQWCLIRIGIMFYNVSSNPIDYFRTYEGVNKLSHITHLLIENMIDYHIDDYEPKYTTTVICYKAIKQTLNNIAS